MRGKWIILESNRIAGDCNEPRPQRQRWWGWLAMFLVIAPLASTALAKASDNLVQARFIAETTAVQPGVAFDVALQLSVAPGWHVYWKNPGDAGAATQFKLDLPQGWKAGPVQFPVPEKIEQAGGITIYAYEHELTLLVQITPPMSLPAATTIRGTASWCVCADVCVLGNKAVELSLPVARLADVANADVFDGVRKKLPVTPDRAFSSVHASPKGLSLQWRGDAPLGLIWFPESDEASQVSADIQSHDRQTDMVFHIVPVKGIPQIDVPISGILAYHDRDGTWKGVAMTVDRHDFSLR